MSGVQVRIGVVLVLSLVYFTLCYGMSVRQATEAPGLQEGPSLAISDSACSTHANWTRHTVREATGLVRSQERGPSKKPLAASRSSTKIHNALRTSRQGEREKHVPVEVLLNEAKGTNESSPRRHL